MLRSLSVAALVTVIVLPLGAAQVSAATSAGAQAAPMGSWTSVDSVQDLPPRRVLKAGDRTARTSTGPSSAMLLAQVTAAPTATFTITYQGFTATQQASFQKAVDIWSHLVVSSVPIQINARLATLEPGVLGSAGPIATYSDGSTRYAVALANSLAGRDLDTSRADIAADFTNDASLLYFGTDGRPPAGTYDFPTIVLHEIAHGLGYFGGAQVVNGLGTYDPGSANPQPFTWDRQTVRRTATGSTPILDYPRDSLALAEALQSGQVFWAGANAVAGAGGAQPRLYAPPVWEPGSSYSHLDEISYPPGDRNALMTPVLFRQEVALDPGPISLGMLADQGWRLSAPATPTAPSPSPSPSASASSSPAPASPPAPGTAPAGSTPSPSSASPSPTASTAPSAVPIPPALPASTAGGAGYVALAPQRLLDTRDGTGGPAGRVGPAGSVDLAVAGLGQVPGEATAVVLNVTAAAASGSTDVRVYPVRTGGPVPEVSNLNLAAGQTRANLVTVAVGEGGRVRLRNAAGSVHLIADLAGYYAPAASAGLFPLDPQRVLDTRVRSGATTLGPGEVLTLQVAGARQVPATARAVVLGVTAVGATRPTDVRVYPARVGGAVPLVSNLNVVPGGPVPNLVIVQVGDNGLIQLRNTSGEVALVADLFGYYDTGSGAARFRALSPTRLLDTRPGRPGPQEVVDVDTAGRAGIPSSVTAVALNVTGVRASASTDIRVYPTPLTASSLPPSVSTLNLVRGQTAADAALVRTGNGGGVRLFNSSGSVGLLVDVAGWFGP